mmetsp:Transcript_11383/g.25840  ORF Transcript_11383/g.25840 Transcript_11383/m.25840 type:complete len:205 (+) Transcript_11383:73-687(+)
MSSWSPQHDARATSSICQSRLAAMKAELTDKPAGALPDGKAIGIVIGDSGPEEHVFIGAQDCIDQGVTTLMVHGIPSDSGVQAVVEKLEADGFASCFDYVYTPFWTVGQLKGYAFVNFVSADLAARLVQYWENTSFEADGSVQLHFTAAKIQGLEANVKKMLQRKLNRIRHPKLRPYIAPIITAAPFGKKLLMGSEPTVVMETL